MLLLPISGLLPVLGIPVLRIRDVYPGSRILIFYPSRISDPGSKNLNKREGWKKFYNHKFHKIENYFIFEMLKKTNWFSFFSKNYRNFYQKFVTKLFKIWVWGLGSGIRDPEQTYSRSGIRVKGSNRHRIPDPLSATLGDPWHFGADPDPRIRNSDWWIRILLFSSVTFKMATKKNIFKALWLLLFEGTFTSFF